MGCAFIHGTCFFLKTKGQYKQESNFIYMIHKKGILQTRSGLLEPFMVSQPNLHSTLLCLDLPFLASQCKYTSALNNVNTHTQNAALLAKWNNSEINVSSNCHFIPILTCSCYKLQKCQRFYLVSFISIGV